MKHLFLLAILISCATTPPQDIVDIQEAIIQLDAGIVQAPPYREVFTTKSSLKWVRDAVAVSNCVINNEEFLSEVENYPKFTFTDKTGKAVVKVLREHSPVVVRTYKTVNPYSKTNAYVVPSRPHEIYVNTRKHGNPIKTWVKTLSHETLHPEFDHGGNDITKNTAAKLESVNFKVGSIAEKYAQGCL